MRKKIIFIIIAVLLGAFTLSACAQTEVEKQLLNNLSELRQNIYEGGDETIAITVITGKKEEPFNVDGVHNAVKEFTVISIKPEYAGAPLEYTYTVVCGDKQFEGKFQIHPFGTTYETDLKQEVDGEDFKISIKGTDYDKEFTLERKRTADMIEWNEALSIGADKLKDDIAELYVNGVFEGEVFVRFIGNMSQIDKGYYWYVAFVGKNAQTYAVLINPTTKEIIAQKSE